jgi:hypothetical protein
VNWSGSFRWHVDGPRIPSAWLSLLALLLGLASPAAMAYWELIPHVEAGVTLEDNPRYLNDSTKSAAEEVAPGITDNVMGTFVDARLTGSYKTPANEIRLTPEVRKTNYLKSNKDLNGDTWVVDLLATHNDRRGGVGLSASYRETGVRNSEYESATPDNPNAPPDANGGSGRFAGDETQTTKEARPFLNYILSPRNSLELSFSTSDVTYDRNASFALPGDIPNTSAYFDYTYEQTALTINHYLNDKNFLQVSLNGGGFESQQPGRPFRNSSDSFGINAAYNRVITPTLSASANVGVTRSSVELRGLQFDPLTGTFCPQDALCSASNEDRNLVGDIGLRKRSELTTMNFNVTRSLAPSSNGTEVVRNQFRFYVNRTVTERLSAGAAAVYIDETAVASAERVDRTYLTIDTTVTWRLTATLSAYGTYTYVSNEYDRTINNSQSTNNRLYLGFSYQGVGFRR